MSETSHPTKTRFNVQGMDCAGCAIKIENALRRMPGVTEVDVSVAGGAVTVAHDQSNAPAMRSQIAGLGYVVIGSEEVGAKLGHDHREEATGPENDAGHSHIHDSGPTDQSWWQTPKGRLTIASGAALAVAFAVGKAIPATEQWAFLLAMLVGLMPIARRAFSAAMCGHAVLDRNADDDRGRRRGLHRRDRGGGNGRVPVPDRRAAGRRRRRQGARQHPGPDHACAEDRPARGR